MAVEALPLDSALIVKYQLELTPADAPVVRVLLTVAPQKIAYNKLRYSLLPSTMAYIITAFSSGLNL